MHGRPSNTGTQRLRIAGSALKPSKSDASVATDLYNRPVIAWVIARDIARVMAGRPHTVILTRSHVNSVERAARVSE
jgi:hypothetical protein